MNQENLDIEEQPRVVETFAETEANNQSSSNVDCDENVESSSKSEAERGVPIGKFKSVDDLFEAYNNLQSEFTRKCQRLAELEKDKMCETAESKDKEQSAFQTFLANNPEAFSYADEIKSRVERDESLKKESGSYDRVWADIVMQKLYSPNKAEEPLVQDLLLKDAQLKNLIIENYVKQLHDNQTPVVISTKTGERVTKVVTPQPDSFEQAKRVVLDLFSQN